MTEVWVPVSLALSVVLMAIAVMLAIPLGLFNRLMRVAPAAHTPTASRELLRAALLSLDDESHPWTLAAAPPTGRADIIAEWRLADARWWTFIRRNGLSVTYRALISLDAPSHEVRIYETTGRVEWSVGGAAPSVHWSGSFFRGIVIFERSREIAYGLVEPRLHPGAAVNYDFDPWRVKGPILRAAVEHGWTYAPVVHEFQLGPRRRGS